MFCTKLTYPWIWSNRAKEGVVQQVRRLTDSHAIGFGEFLVYKVSLQREFTWKTVIFVIVQVIVFVVFVAVNAAYLHIHTQREDGLAQFI